MAQPTKSLLQMKCTRVYLLSSLMLVRQTPGLATPTLLVSLATSRSFGTLTMNPLQPYLQMTIVSRLTGITAEKKEQLLGYPSQVQDSSMEQKLEQPSPGSVLLSSQPSVSRMRPSPQMGVHSIVVGTQGSPWPSQTQLTLQSPHSERLKLVKSWPQLPLRSHSKQDSSEEQLRHPSMAQGWHSLVVEFKKNWLPSSQARHQVSDQQIRQLARPQGSQRLMLRFRKYWAELLHSRHQVREEQLMHPVSWQDSQQRVDWLINLLRSRSQNQQLPFVSKQQELLRSQMEHQTKETQTRQWGRAHNSQELKEVLGKQFRLTWHCSQVSFMVRMQLSVALHSAQVLTSVQLMQPSSPHTSHRLSVVLITQPLAQVWQAVRLRQMEHPKTGQGQHRASVELSMVVLLQVWQAVRLRQTEHPGMEQGWQSWSVEFSKYPLVVLHTAHWVREEQVRHWARLQSSQLREVRLTKQLGESHKAHDPLAVTQYDPVELQVWQKVELTQARQLGIVQGTGSQVEVVEFCTKPFAHTWQLVSLRHLLQLAIRHSEQRLRVQLQQVRLGQIHVFRQNRVKPKRVIGILAEFLFTETGMWTPQLPLVRFWKIKQNTMEVSVLQVEKSVHPMMALPMSSKGTATSPPAVGKSIL